VNTATGPLDGQPPARERRVMGTSAAITVIAVGAILRFALGSTPRMRQDARKTIFNRGSGAPLLTRAARRVR
jgi:hypothetical protein